MEEKENLNEEVNLEEAPKEEAKEEANEVKESSEPKKMCSLKKDSKLVYKGISIGLAFGGLGMAVMAILGFITFASKEAIAGLIVGIVGAILAACLIGVVIFNAITKKIHKLNTVAGTVSGFSIGIIGIVVGIVIAVTTPKIASNGGGKGGDIPPGDLSPDYDSLSTTMYVFPEENEKGELGLSVFGGDYEGEYLIPLYEFSDTRLYNLDFKEATYDTNEEKVYTLRSINLYIDTLFDEDVVTKEYVEEGETPLKLAKEILTDAIKDVAEQIQKLEVIGDVLPFSTDGFKLDYYALPYETSSGSIGFSVNKDNWVRSYGFELPAFTDTRYYTNKTTESTEFAGGIIEYELNIESTLFDLFYKEIMNDWNGLSGQGYYEYETHTDLEKEWFKRCFNLALAPIYQENSLYHFKRPGEPSLVDQLKFVRTYGGEAYCCGVNPEYISTLKEVIIPDKITLNNVDYPVTKINENAFYANDVITSVVIGDNVKSVGKHAFSSCTNLELFAFKVNENSKSRAYIGSYAFVSCSSLKYFGTNGAVYGIGDYAFSRCDGLTSITFDNQLLDFGTGAFSYCNNLTSVTLSNDTKILSTYMFAYCPKLANLDLSRVQVIEDGAFYKCNLSKVTLPSSLYRLGKATFRENEKIEFEVSQYNETYLMHKGFLLERDAELYKIIDANYNVGLEGEPKFGYDDTDTFKIKEVCDGALSYKHNLVSLKFGPSLEILGSTAFLGDENLEYVDLSKTNIGRIDASTFKDCAKLTRFTSANEETHKINGKIKGISCGAFEGSGITKLYLDEETNLRDLQPACFSNMKKLVQISLPKEIRLVFGLILNGCESLGEGVDYAIIYAGSISSWQEIEYLDVNWKGDLDQNTLMHFVEDNMTKAIRDVK